MRYAIIFAFLLVGFSDANGQTLSGVVVDNFGIALQEVNILNKSKDRHTHSDEEGRFIFENVSDSLISSANSPLNLGCMVATFPSMTFPV